MADLLSRFQPLDAPRARPGCCFICRGTQNGPFIDTRINVDFEGAVIICRACITQMFRQLDLGMVVNESEVEARVLAAHENGKIVGRELALEALREFLGSYQSPGLDALLRDLAVTTFVATPEVTPGEPESSDGDSVADTTTDAPSSKQGNGTRRKSGRADVPGDSSDGSVVDIPSVLADF